MKTFSYPKNCNRSLLLFSCSSCFLLSLWKSENENQACSSPSSSSQAWFSHSMRLLKRGFHFYNFFGSRHVGSINWSDPSDPRIFKAIVNVITTLENSVFATFNCSHRENCILKVDKAKIQIVSQLGRQFGNQAKHMIPAKLTWIPAIGVLVGSAVTGGEFGYSGYIRLWDPRSGQVVWEMNEPGAGLGLGMADMTRLGDDTWVYLKEKNPSLVASGGGDGSISSVVNCYKGQVFVGRGGELEVWSRVQEVAESEIVSETEGLYRRNFIDKREDLEKGVIKKIEGGGDRLFVSREDVEGILANFIL